MEGIFSEGRSLKDAVGVRGCALGCDSCSALQRFPRCWGGRAGASSTLLTRMGTDWSKERAQR